MVKKLELGVLIKISLNLYWQRKNWLDLKVNIGLYLIILKVQWQFITLLMVVPTLSLKILIMLQKKLKKSRWKMLWVKKLPKFSLQLLNLGLWKSSKGYGRQENQKNTLFPFIRMKELRDGGKTTYTNCPLMTLWQFMMI